MEPFEVRIDDAALADLDRRLRAARRLEGDGADAPDCGVTVSDAKRLRDHWLDRFDWRAHEARINRQPQVMIVIDGLALHTIDRRSPRAGAIPLLLIHGWPTSFLEFLDICEALAEPVGGGPAFHVVVPSLPGYGFSQTRPGTSPRVIAGLFAQMMTRLGHDRFLIQGGNWGSTIGTEMARLYPERVIGLHLNSVNGSAPPDPPALSPEDRALAETYATLLSFPHFNLLAQTPLTLAHALNDSPVGLAAWLGERLRGWADPELPGNPALSPEWTIANAALAWFTGTAGSSAMLYREAVRDPAPQRFVDVPTAVAHFAGELVMIPRAWAEHDYNIARWSRYPVGGHYPAVEVPELFVRDLREFASELGEAHKPG